MGEPGHRARDRIRHEHIDDEARGHRIGHEALHFAKWFLRSKFALMEGFLGELEAAPEERDAAELEHRFLRCTRHAQRVLLARSIVSFLLVLGAVATVGTALLARFGTVRIIGALEAAAAIAGSLTVLLLAMRLAMDRYLERVEVSATFIAMQLATARPRLTGGAATRSS